MNSKVLENNNCIKLQLIRKHTYICKNQDKINIKSDKIIII